MGRERKPGPGVASGHAKERHKKERKGKVIDWSAPLPPGLKARPDEPQISSRHKTWFEWVENKDKKKKLEFKFTEEKNPPPGFEFVPIGNPALTNKCKELSRELGAMIFIVTTSSGPFSRDLSKHLNRIGHHVRESIVEQARVAVGYEPGNPSGLLFGIPEPIPETQEEINRQADLALRDLFPRIPNTDRQLIIDRSFNKSVRVGPNEEKPVGLAADIPLSRRVQLAVLAHIRHTHTRYDQLLRETSYVNARKAVESLCLDLLVKWRGDEETGRDQLDEILCEVIVISDSESEDDEIEYEDDSDSDSESPTAASSAEKTSAGNSGNEEPQSSHPKDYGGHRSATLAAKEHRPGSILRATHGAHRVRKADPHPERKAAKWAQRGFSRYQAARDQAWQDAVERQRRGNDTVVRPTPAPVALGQASSHTSQSVHETRFEYAASGPTTSRSPRGFSHHVRHHSYGAAYGATENSADRREWSDHPGGPQRVVSWSPYHVPEEIRGPESRRTSRSGSIVGSRPVGHAVPRVEWVEHRGQDLSNHLVRSIERPSPEPSAFLPRPPDSHLRQDLALPRIIEASRNPSGIIPYPETARYVSAMPHSSVAPARDTHLVSTEEGFIRLPPRHETGRHVPAVGTRRESHHLVSSQVQGPAPSYAASAGPGRPRSPIYHGTYPTRTDGPSLRSAARPIWIGEDVNVPSSALRPIVIPDSPNSPRHSARESSSRLVEPKPYVPPEPLMGVPIYRDIHNHGMVEMGTQRQVENLSNEFVEIVQVSDRFPRRYEPPPAPAPIQHRGPQPAYVGVARYDRVPELLPAPRLERVVSRSGQPVYEYGVPIMPADGYSRSLGHQELMPNVEYRQIHPRDENEAIDARSPARLPRPGPGY